MCHKNLGGIRNIDKKTDPIIIPNPFYNSKIFFNQNTY